MHLVADQPTPVCLQDTKFWILLGSISIQSKIEKSLQF